MTKKEDRLSPKARKLLEVARTKFSTQPEKAVRYLMSIKPSELTMYDRQKIGREILNRMYAENYHSYEGADAKNKLLYNVRTDYNLSLTHHDHEGKRGVRKSDYRRPKEQERIFHRQNRGSTSGKRFYYATTGKSFLKSARDKSELIKDDLTYWKNHGVSGCICPGSPINYIIASENYEKAELYNRAIESYKEMLKNMKKLGILKVNGMNTQAVNEEIRRLERLKAERSKKHGLENTLTTTAIISLLGGIFFLSNNITGNAIGNMTNLTFNIIGVGLLIIGLIAGFFWLKKR